MNSHSLTVGSCVQYMKYVVSLLTKAHTVLPYYTLTTSASISLQDLKMAPIPFSLFLCCNTSTVGSDYLATRHRNTLIFEDTCTFRNNSQFSSSWKECKNIYYASTELVHQMHQSLMDRLMEDKRTRSGYKIGYRHIRIRPWHNYIMVLILYIMVQKLLCWAS